MPELEGVSFTVFVTFVFSQKIGNISCAIACRVYLFVFDHVSLYRIEGLY